MTHNRPNRLIIATVMALAGCLASGPANGEPSVSDNAEAGRFDSQIAPLLARRCLGCHNPQENKGELDLTRVESALAEGGPIVAGKVGESLLWQRVADNEMPPKKPLTEAEKQLLKDWIAAGAAWGTSPIDRFQFTTDARAGYDWWALKPVQKAQPPTVRRREWPLSPIDCFVLSQLEVAGIEPSPAADRRTLVRRLSFDLTGLPPTPEHVAAFVADADPRAYERLVDSLLASPHYGERWARHWLDLVRFGESNGFEYDEPRPNAWPYRDWVIDALDRDMPFDEFARQQLAGDALSDRGPETIKATGFLVAGAFDTVGQNQQSMAMKAVVRQDELEDMVGTVAQAFLGLTVNCARCHDHKFDPVRQAEYYQFTSALSGVRHGERDVTSVAAKAEYTRRAADRQARIDAIKSRLAAIDEPIRARILAQRKAIAAPAETTALPISRWDFDQSLRDTVGNLHGTAHGSATVSGQGLELDGQSFVATAPLEKDLHAKTLEVWLSLGRLQQAGGGAIGVQTLSGAIFDSIVFGEREAGRWVAGSNNFTRTQEFSGAVEDEADGRIVHIAMVYAADGTIAAYRDGLPYGNSYRAAGPQTFKAGEAQVVFGLRHAPAGGNRMLSGVIQRARLYDRALSAQEVLASATAGTDFVSQADLVARLAEDARAARQRLAMELITLQITHASSQRELCHANAPRKAEVARLLLRGDIRTPGPIVAAGGVAALGGASAQFGLAPDAPEEERRVALARWITSPHNPLFSRVIVNRLWHYHFGVGIVDTPNDFGFNGGRPSHLELLDWLAATLVERGWSLKQLHREIVLSATYRQASLGNALAARLDADNRHLWRKSRGRLEAEVVRDAMLCVAGELNPTRGGPGFRDSKEVLRSGTYTYEPDDPVGFEFNRRSIYRSWIRGGRNGLLDAFDCPDPSTTSPKRAVTTTPLQALALLNNSFVLRMADKLALRVAREAGQDPSDQVTRVYQLAYSRDPDGEELAFGRQVVGEHGLATLARAVFNSNELLYVD